MNAWNEIYTHFNPIAFEIAGFKVYWYGMAYVVALLGALFIAKRFIKTNPRFASVTSAMIDSYFVYAELGVILGARFGYVFIYDPNSMYYLTHPWQALNPFMDGHFVGIAGMSYHGGVIGFIIGSLLFAYVKKINIFIYLDLVALSLPLAYVFGRIGNFLNKELFGRPIVDAHLKFIGIYVDGYLRYPSQLIEAFLEGIVVFFIVLFVSKKIRFNGALITIYGMAYSFMRFMAEFTREPDIQLGFYGDFTMGQILSVIMFIISAIVFILCLKWDAKKRVLQTSKEKLSAKKVDTKTSLNSMKRKLKSTKDKK
ncbi:prolipoprotein diacylglyceryl transferase [Helicobacter sp. 11S02629-2]|uniref:prolipoprotein diacylglyceryl transferase n=1 Tax=Helicobacter sp. 11S02629-2 TaxID=1476195 RepID=UPI000BA5FDB8|nr:prolipoprotein diacylglyceryl transferase [Helicobacter sp. 11S02629-2]PAF44085.1 prolipoprotein diacylglyceryl transferase [Helicobacter sp. 11S02629-2]